MCPYVREKVLDRAPSLEPIAGKVSAPASGCRQLAGHIAVVVCICLSTTITAVLQAFSNAQNFLYESYHMMPPGASKMQNIVAYTVLCLTWLAEKQTFLVPPRRRTDGP